MTETADSQTQPQEELAPETSRQPDQVAFGAHDAEPAGQLTVLRFGTSGARPKVVLQAGLHADELPGMLVLRDLAARLAEAERRGEIIGEVVVVPVANPLGLAQQRFGILQGRFDEASGENFNRKYPDLAALIQDKLVGQLGTDPEANVATIRAAMHAALDRMHPVTAIDGLRKALLGLACDADIVLDLHADNEALVHLYTLPVFWPAAEDLAAELDARAVLLASVSGENPFDEACSTPWLALSDAFPESPVPPACIAATVELRSNNAVETGLMESDAAALMRVLQRRGAVAGEPGALPRLLCDATPLEAMQQVRAGAEGIITYHARLGDTMRAGDLIATISDPLGGDVEILAETDGALFARHEQRYVWPGKVIAKIAGQTPLPGRTGNLLTE
ncbi:succinylglutamate desuccinylase/aspartoacylase family protein [Roseivivax sp. CAU 1753]